MTPDPKQDYERRKRFLEDCKRVSTAVYQEMFRVLKAHNVEYSENSNGIFFDVAQVSHEVFDKLNQCIERNKEQTTLDAKRVQELDALRSKGTKAK